MHIVDLLLWLFEPNASCMYIKFVALHIKWTLGGQIYGFDALRPIIIDCIVLDKDGLGESFMGLGDSGCIFHQILSVYGLDVKIEGSPVV